MRICIIIPAYNEERTIGELVRTLKSKNRDIVVINDGSTDRSGEIAAESGAHVIMHLKKQGKGVSLRDGFAYALENNFDGVIAMDGDGQHDPKDVEKFIKKAEEFPDGIINGSRMTNPKNMPGIRYVTNKFMSVMISAVCHQSILDSQCGFRFISSRILRSIILTSCDFEIETEVLIKASRKGFRIHSVDVQTIYRDESSKINPILDTLRFFVFMTKQLITTRRS